MYDQCKTCLAPIYPPGISYTGQACFYHGNHPHQSFNDPTAVNKLLESNQRLSQRLARIEAKLWPEENAKEEL